MKYHAEEHQAQITFRPILKTMSLTKLFNLVGEFRRMERVSIDLMHAASAGNDPFFGHVVRDYYSRARGRHPRYLLFPNMVYGVALCRLPPAFDDYYMQIEASARRNHKKARREGCTFEPIDFNEHLAAIREIRQSADARQGRPMPESYRQGILRPCSDPPSRSPIHAYPYFGIFYQGQLVGYAGCLIAGEVCILEHILGHAGHLSLGVVPQLIIGIAERLYAHHPQVRYFVYGTYFGAGETMRRFKRKFGFVPHRVEWLLDRPGVATAPVSSRSEKALVKT
jgi:hypothetical protein